MCPSRQNNEALEASEPRSLQLSGALAEPLLDRLGGRRDQLRQWGLGESTGCSRAARGKPISQIIGLDLTVVPRYPAFIRLPDWGRGARRRRRGSNYGCSSPVAGRWRRAGPAGRAGRGGRSGDRVCRSPGRPLGRGASVPRAAPAPRRGSALHASSSAPPAQLPHCLLWSLRSPFPSPPSLPPSFPLLSPLLLKEKKSQSVETNES